MAKKQSKKKSGGKDSVEKNAAVLEKPRSKPKRKQRLTNAKLKTLAEKNKPPQSWYEQDEAGLW